MDRALRTCDERAQEIDEECERTCLRLERSLPRLRARLREREFEKSLEDHTPLPKDKTSKTEEQRKRTLRYAEIRDIQEEIRDQVDLLRRCRTRTPFVDHLSNLAAFLRRRERRRLDPKDNPRVPPPPPAVPQSPVIADVPGPMDEFVATLPTNIVEEMDELDDQEKEDLEMLTGTRVTCDPFIRNIFRCLKCAGHPPLIYDQTEATLICRECGESKNYQETTLDCFPYGTPRPSMSASEYHELNRFNEWMCNVQFKEKIEVPQIIVDMVHDECRKHKKTNAQINRTLVRRYLKKLEREYKHHPDLPRDYFSHWYDHSSQIASRITRLPPLQLTRIQEDNLRMKFRETLPPYEKCPFKRTGKKQRDNYLSYPYVFRKLCELLEYDDFAEMFPRLKSGEKEREHDKIWKFVCDSLLWEFIPSQYENR